MMKTARRVALIHNVTAGDGAHGQDELIAMITAAGYSVTYHDARGSDLPAVLRDPADLLVVAGGDGTVRRVVAAAPPSAPPIAILPFGRANNIAKSLGIDRPTRQLVESWRSPGRREFFPISAETPWGQQRLVEGIGFGMLAQAILELRGSKPVPATARQHIAELALSAEPVELTVTADGADLSGIFSVLEVMTIPLVGPNILWAPSASPSNDLSVAFAGVSTEERQCLSAWLSAGATKTPPPLTNRNAKHVLISGTFRGVRIDDIVRTDDENSGGTITLARDAQPLCFLVPASA